MEDWYYSKKLGRRFPRRLDFLVYAHDGRGLGHASRGVAVGMALRRLFPDRPTLFVSGCKQTAALIGPAPLDWIKLPSYETTVVDGQAEGFDGNSGYYKSVLGRHRRDMLASLVQTLKPRSVLVDHAPFGKRDELSAALEASRDFDTQWVLGIRGVVGTDPDIWSEKAAAGFKKYYHELLWYGDENILGPGYPKSLDDHFGRRPVEAGYVSRLDELARLMDREDDTIAGTVSITWTTAATWKALDALAVALGRIGDRYGPWRFFVNRQDLDRIRTLFQPLPFARVEEISEGYFSSLLSSRAAVIYGGYNSLTDILAARAPAVVFLRDISDPEQENHVERLVSADRGTLAAIPEKEADGDALFTILDRILAADRTLCPSLKMNGAETAAEVLGKMI